MAPLPRLLLAVALLHAAAASAATDDGEGGRRRARYDRVFSFGDSLTDTGNALHLSPTGAGPASRPPYGETFFRRPTGRASDGRLVVDFIVEALGVPHPTPYLAGKAAADFRRGANFAVGGATALDLNFFESRGLTPFVPVSLDNQTSWFKNVLHLLGSVEEQRKITSTSLFLVGEIGVNDYFVSALGRNRTVGEVKTFVPRVVAAVGSVITDVIAAGARTVVVPGMIPLGCEPQLLAHYKGGAGAGEYDPESGCLTRLNDLAELHNRELRRMLSGLRRAHPGTAVVYADLYRAVTDLVVSPAKLQEQAAGRVLRRRRRRVQLRRRRVLRRGGHCCVRRPVGVRLLGRGAFHGGRQQAHRLRRARGLPLARRRRRAGAVQLMGHDGGLASQDRLRLVSSSLVPSCELQV
ncbi:hypothetical protein PAHAL_9G294400 [Panicum hallii]|uniref:GDSL esterase/lipase n=1 Tax=Panicum hallii TaxID=206008 RepID=A0A2T8I2Y1_9POAL|nr:hypothetical protein PAHAL_9G294400 [Panicum hallii]